MFAVVVGLVAFGARASAQSAVLRRPSLHWVRSEESLRCVDPRTLSERVEELVGPVLVRAPEAEHSVEAQVKRVKSDALRVEVRVLNAWGTKVGERTFEHQGSECAELTPAIAFVIAMMIDPDVAAHGLPPALLALLGEEPAEELMMRELEAEPPSPPPPPVITRRPRRILPPPHVADERAPEPRPTSHQLAALVRGGWHESARGTLGLEVRYLQRVVYPWLTAGGYTRFGRQIGSFDWGSQLALALSALDFGLQLCGGQASTARFRMLGCLGVEVTTAFGRGEGFTPDRLQVMTTGAAVAQLTARLRIYEPFGVMLSIHGRTALERREFSYENADQEPVVVFRTPIFGGGIALGPSWEF